MKKTLRFMAISLMAMVCGSAFAQTVVWEENWDGYDPAVNPATMNSNYTFVGTVLNDDNTVKSGTKIYNETLAGGAAPELLINKNGGSFAAKINLNGASGELTLQFKCNRNTLGVSVEGATLGEVTAAGNDYIYPVTVAAGTSQITITFSNTTSSNARFDNAKLISGVTIKPAGISWGTASRTVTMGAEDNNFPTLSNNNGLSVTYTSSDETVATINAEGEITLVAAGKTTITASFAGNNQYEAAEVSYELTVKEASVEPVVTDVTVAQALDVIDALDDNGKTTAQYTVTGYITQIVEVSLKYANATFYIADTPGGTPTLYLFRVKGSDDVKIETETVINVGDKVVVKGLLQKYVKNGETTPEIGTDGIIVSNLTTGIKSATTVEADNAPAYNVAGQKVGAAYKGIVIKNGKKAVVK